MKKSDVEYVASVARIKNRVAVKKYYYDELPKDIRSLAFTVSNLETLRQIELVKRSLENAISKGDSFKTWRDNLDLDIIRNLSNARLETVYRTNVNNVYNQSTRFNAFTSGVTPYLMYSAVGDERTRPEHMKLDGIVKRADSKFWDEYTPPLGFNCTASYQRVSGDFTKGFRSFYKGDMVYIELKSGKRIVGVTPNHPMMTDRGFVFAQNLNCGQKLVRENREIKGLSLSVEKNNYDLVTSASDRFKSILLHGLGLVKSTSFNFNNDIKFMDKNVDVVTCDCLLSSDPKIFEGTTNLVLVFANNAFKRFKLSVLGKASAIKSYILIMKNIFNKRSGYSEKLCDLSGAFKFSFVEMLSPVFNFFNIFSKEFLRRRISCLNSGRPEPSIDNISTDIELVTKFENARPSIVETDEVVNVYVYPYFGFVYDFESIHGMVITEGIVTSNCRCGVVPMTKESAESAGISKKSNDSFPEPEFGKQKMGDVLSASSKATEEAISSMKPSRLKSKFKESQENISSLVDIWFSKNEDLFNQG